MLGPWSEGQTFPRGFRVAPHDVIAYPPHCTNVVSARAPGRVGRGGCGRRCAVSEPHILSRRFLPQWHQFPPPRSVHLCRWRKRKHLLLLRRFMSQPSVEEFETASLTMTKHEFSPTLCSHPSRGFHTRHVVFTPTLCAGGARKLIQSTYRRGDDPLGGATLKP